MTAISSDDLEQRLKNIKLTDWVRATVRDHDRSCSSMTELWWAEEGQIGPPRRLYDCERCGGSFFQEGITEQEVTGTDRRDEPGVYLCECCTRQSCSCRSNLE